MIHNDLSMPNGTLLGGLSGAPKPNERRAISRDLTPRQTRLIQMLRNGGRHSAIDISVHLHIGDARSEIRNLRRMGYTVNDVWVNGKEGARYKRYWMNKP